MTPRSGTEYLSSAQDVVDKLADPERLAALRESGLLSKSIAQRLDHLAFAAARMVLADASQINALDQEHQFTVMGWPPDDEEYPVFPTETTGCREVVLTGLPFVVPNARSHPVTCNMPWAQSFQAYLGVPVTYKGHVLGSLCVLGVEPRDWKSYEVSALQGVARLVGMSLDGASHD